MKIFCRVLLDRLLVFFVVVIEFMRTLLKHHGVRDGHNFWGTILFFRSGLLERSSRSAVKILT